MVARGGHGCELSNGTLKEGNLKGEDAVDVDVKRTKAALYEDVIEVEDHVDAMMDPC